MHSKPLAMRPTQSSVMLLFFTIPWIDFVKAILHIIHHVDLNGTSSVSFTKLPYCLGSMCFLYDIYSSSEDNNPNLHL